MSAGVVPAMRTLRTASKVDSSDRNLVSRAQKGDEEAFAALFEMHKKRVYSLCLYMTADVATAEDLTQEVFIHVFRKISTFRGDAAFSTWLHRIAVNTVLMSRRRYTPPQLFLDDPVCVDSALLRRDLSWNDSALSETLERIALIRGIRQLPEGYRTIFILHDVEGYEHAEIARLLNCSSGNSKSQLHKARMKLRELLFPGKAKGLRRMGDPSAGIGANALDPVRSRRTAIAFGSY
jgi:RNA polymerase sigma-70 factor, ECF subfamily